MALLGIVHIVLILVQACIIVPYDQLVLGPILKQVFESFAEIADLVGFIVWVVYKCNL